MFRPVQQRHNRVLIIGGGESLINFDFSNTIDFDGAIITVNNVIKYLPRADYWITVDPCLDKKPQDNMIDRRDDCYYYACYPQLNKSNEEWYPTVEGIHYLERIVPDKSETQELGDYSLQEDKDKITTGDSAYGALGLAYHFEASKIVMLGIDVNGGFGHWYDTTEPYNRNWGDKFTEYQANLPRIYEQSIRQFNARGVKVINGCTNSGITCFDRMTPEQALNYFK